MSLSSQLMQNLFNLLKSRKLQEHPLWQMGITRTPEMAMLPGKGLWPSFCGKRISHLSSIKLLPYHQCTHQHAATMENVQKKGTNGLLTVSSSLEYPCSYYKSTPSSVHNYCYISFGNDWFLSALIAPPLEKVSVSPGSYCSQPVRECLGVIPFCQLTFKYNNVSLLTRKFHLLKSLVLVWHDLPFKTFIWFFPTLWPHDNAIVLIFEVMYSADSLSSPYMQA